jgi:hypothetical protein
MPKPPFFGAVVYMLRSLSAGRLGGLLRSAAEDPSVSYGTTDKQPSLLPAPQLQDSSSAAWIVAQQHLA